MEKGDKGSMLTRIGVRGRMFLLVPAYPGCPGQMDVKWLLLLLFRYILSGRCVSQFIFYFISVHLNVFCLHCFDIVGRVTGRASGL